MNKSINNLQDIFLNNARKERIPVTIFLVNGVQLKGIFTVVLDSDGKQQLVYKHAISTVSPAKPILFNNAQVFDN